MILTKPQVYRFFSEWKAVCLYQQWTGVLSAAEIDLKRKELLANCGFSSLTLVDKTKGFDRVLAELRAMQDDLAAAVEAVNPAIGQARRLREKIQEQLKALALYHPAPDSYLAELIKDKFKFGSHAMPLTVDDLTAEPVRFADRKTGLFREIPSQLDQVVMTLARAIQAKRKAAGHSVEEMECRAGIKSAAEPVLEMVGSAGGDPDWNVS